MKSCTTLILFLSLFLFACSSDPCEEVTCQKGACDEGICACESGYTGAQCESIDIVGTYYRSKIMSDPNTNCNQEYLDYNPQLMGEALCDRLGCTAFLYTFNEDLTMTRTVIWYEDDNPDPLVEDFRSVTEGTYSVDGTTVTLETGLDQGRILTFDDYTLEEYDVFWADCFATRTWTKRTE